MSAIIRQLQADLSRFNVKKRSIDSLFIGGGTPSCVSYHLYKDFFETVLPYMKPKAEITTEANPNSATDKWLKGMKNLGINRISFGVQSFNDKKLKFLGRNHSKDSALKAIENAYIAGIENISLDLIYNTALDSKELIKNDLDIASSLPINHISAYSLTIEENTPFFKTPEVAKDSINLSKFLFENIKNIGFPQYEISNFGRYKSIHNLGYWQHKDYIGIGAGAVGFLKRKRFYPHKSVEEYIKNPTYHETEDISKEDLHIEKIFLGLRSIVGVKLDEFNKDERGRVDILIKEKKLTCKEDRVYNTNYLLSDELTLFITT